MDENLQEVVVNIGVYWIFMDIHGRGNGRPGGCQNPNIFNNLLNFHPKTTPYFRSLDKIGQCADLPKTGSSALEATIFLRDREVVEAASKVTCGDNQIERNVDQREGH